MWLQDGEEADNDDDDDDDDVSSGFSDSEADFSTEEPTVADGLADSPVARTQSLDLVTRIDGMLRILDLVSEQGSGGLGMLLLFQVG